MEVSHSISVVVTPDDCDAFGHVSASGFARLFERARWEAIAQGPGVSVFLEPGLWPAVRKSNMEFYHSAVSGDRMGFETALTHHSHTSFTLHQTARRLSDRSVVAEGDFLIVCLDADGNATQVPAAIGRFFGTRPSVRPGGTQHLAIKGTAMAVDVQGDGPALLFVHGFPLDRTMWRHLMAALTGWRRVAPDLRGMGLSDVPARGYSMAGYADDLVGLMDVLQIESAVVCGLSMGGYVAFELIRRHPDRVRGLVLANTRADADDEEGRAARDKMIADVEQNGTGGLAEKMIPKLLGPSSISAMPRVVEHVQTMIAATPKTGVLGALRAMRDRWDSTPLLELIQVPTLVIAGSEDQIIPVSAAREMSSRISGAELHVIPESGHLTPLEQPIALGRVINEFLESIK